MWKRLRKVDLIRLIEFHTLKELHKTFKGAIVQDARNLPETSCHHSWSNSWKGFNGKTS